MARRQSAPAKVKLKLERTTLLTSALLREAAGKNTSDGSIKAAMKVVPGTQRGRPDKRLTGVSSERPRIGFRRWLAI